MKPSLFVILLVRFSLVLLAATPDAAGQEARRPNVLFVAIDDLNDWASPFGGHPQAITPNLDRFASSGAVVFQNAHCPGPVCGPSRSALMSGFMPYRTGAYGNANNMLTSGLVQANATLPEYFAKHGYRTISRGKIFHAHSIHGKSDQGQWAFQDWSSTVGGGGVDRNHVTSRDKNLIDGKPAPKSKYTSDQGSEFAWGPTRDGLEQTKDYKTAIWAADLLSRPTEQPFFLAVGLSKPHLPFYVPQEFFDLYPIDDVQLPPIREDDLDDILNKAGKPMHRPSQDYLWLKEQGQMKHAVQAYLAATSYADACLGKIFDAVAEGPHADNTIVVVWGDHGWHLGEKLRYRKATAWSESTRCPLIIRTPPMTERRDSESLVNLIDLYPTLVDYCGLPTKSNLDGVSIKPLLSDPSAIVRPSTTTIFGHNRASITDGSWRYIATEEVAEELYDLRSDPQEWTNLITDESAQSRQALQRMRAMVPESFAPSLPNGRAAGAALDVDPGKKRDLSRLN